MSKFGDWRDVNGDANNEMDEAFRMDFTFGSARASWDLAWF